jgi:formate hydrogenlyase subunit 6/NADH:ubiquinone oxidoreductase subunit I
MARKNNLLFALVDALFSRAETVRYPFHPIALSEGFRGAIKFDPERCTGCGLCVRDCPANGLELIRESREVYQLRYHPARCAYCGQCQATCPRGAISHSNKMVSPTTDSTEMMMVLKDTGNE